MSSQNNENYIKDKNFFKKVWYSITKFENYPEMAAHGVPKAILYLAKLMLIFSILLTVIMFFFLNKTASEVNEGENYYTKFENILNINLKETDMEEINQSFSDFDPKTINIVFFIALAISIFISYFLITIVDVFTLSLFGLLTCYMTKIKIKYKAVFNMSIYAITISVILRLIYEGLLLLADFRIKYFDIMYASVAYICLAAAIFMIRSDLIKQQIELVKVLEEKRRKAFEEEQKTKGEEKDKEKQKEKDEEDEKGEDDNMQDGEKQGSNA